VSAQSATQRRSLLVSVPLLGRGSLGAHSSASPPGPHTRSTRLFAPPYIPPSRFRRRQKTTPPPRTIESVPAMLTHAMPVSHPTPHAAACRVARTVLHIIHIISLAFRDARLRALLIDGMFMRSSDERQSAPCRVECSDVGLCVDRHQIRDGWVLSRRAEMC
jgi:hypothetical protein